MTRSGVERSQRTASRPAYAQTLSAVSLPFANQATAAEDPGRGASPRGPVSSTNATRLADRAVVRLGLRGLAVAGFAGAAWLLSANAAQAAEAPASDPSVLDVLAVSGGQAGPDSLVTSVLPTSVTEAVTPASQPVTGTVSTSTSGAIAPDRTATAGALPSATAARAVPIAGALSTVTRAVAQVTGGVTDRITDAVPPVTDTVRTVTRTVNRTVTRPVTATLDGVTGVAGLTGQRILPLLPSRSTAWPAADGLGSDGLGTGGIVAGTPSRFRSAGAAVHHGRSWTGQRATGAPAVRQGTGEVPHRPRPAPVRGYLGTGPGALTCGSGPGTERAGGAVASTPVAAGTVGSHRVTDPTDVAVARQEAESPTVSPD